MFPLLLLTHISIGVFTHLVHRVFTTELIDTLVVGLRQCSKLIVFQGEVFFRLVVHLHFGNKICPTCLLSFVLVWFCDFPIFIHPFRRKQPKHFRDFVFGTSFFSYRVMFLVINLHIFSSSCEFPMLNSCISKTFCGSGY